MTAIIFDMDGVLIDSEPLWHEAEKTVFAGVGIHLTTADCLKTTGLRIDEVVRQWYCGSEPLAERIIDDVIRRITTRGEPKPGVAEALDACGERPIALASSSSSRIITAVLARLGITHRFSVIHSAEHEPFGKPHPAVYLTTARKLGVAPKDCIAIEDSPNGVRAAQAAGMRCIAIPDAGHAITNADLVLPDLFALATALRFEYSG